MTGRVLRPGEAGFGAARRLFNPRFDGRRPQAVVRCQRPSDVQAVVEFCRDNRLPLTARAGGHSYGGWSTGAGVVVDLRPMSDVLVHGSEASVGAGARLVDVYASLAAKGRAVAAGSCPTVGIAGLTLGGGIGVLTRAWGLTCDQLVSLDVVTADGTLRTADAGQEPDLFWACRGGGGGQVGIATRLGFRTHQARPVTIFYLGWPWSAARTVLAAWQGWMQQAPDRLWSTCKLLTVPGGAEPRVFVGGTWLGSTTGLQGELDDLTASVGRTTSARSATTYDFLAGMLREAGCSNVSAARCTTARSAYDSASNVLLRPMRDDAVDLAVDRVAARQRADSRHEDGFSFDALGGAVARLAADATAFPYRQAVAVGQYNVNWSLDDAAAAVAAGREWLHDFRREMTALVGDHAYVNYADPTLRDFGAAYYGGNLERLAAIRQRYDPDGLLHFPQSVVA